MLPPFRMGVGGKIGNGKQWMSWIALDDVIGAIKFVLTNDSLNGPVNFVAPNPVTNAEFTKTLGKSAFATDAFSRFLRSACAWRLVRWPMRCCFRANESNRNDWKTAAISSSTHSLKEPCVSSAGLREIHGVNELE